MSEMIVQVRNKMLRRIGGVNHFVSHNKDYTIRFQFDESWDNVRTKMAVFAYEDGEYGSEIFDGDTCAVPELPREGRILIGIKAGEDLSTELLCVPVCKSADDVITDEYDAPDPKIYEQILDIINNLWNGGTTVYPSPVRFLAAPNKAEVGQFVRVKRVDENGEIEETEAVDAPKKLSDFENDLYYKKIVPDLTITLTKDDFTLNDEAEAYVYRKNGMIDSDLFKTAVISIHGMLDKIENPELSLDNMDFDLDDQDSYQVFYSMSDFTVYISNGYSVADNPGPAPLLSETVQSDISNSRDFVEVLIPQFMFEMLDSLSINIEFSYIKTVPKWAIDFTNVYESENEIYAEMHNIDNNLRDLINKTYNIPVVTTTGTVNDYKVTTKNGVGNKVGDLLIVIPHVTSTSLAMKLTVNDGSRSSIYINGSNFNGDLTQLSYARWFKQYVPYLLLRKDSFSLIAIGASGITGIGKNNAGYCNSSGSSQNKYAYLNTKYVNSGEFDIFGIVFAHDNTAENPKLMIKGGGVGVYFENYLDIVTMNGESILPEMIKAGKLYLFAFTHRYAYGLKTGLDEKYVLLNPDSETETASLNFPVTITSTITDDVTTYAADKTFSEIKEAYESGANVYAVDSLEQDIFPLRDINSSSTGGGNFGFYGIRNDFQLGIWISINNDDVISVYKYNLLTSKNIKTYAVRIWETLADVYSSGSNCYGICKQKGDVSSTYISDNVAFPAIIYVGTYSHGEASMRVIDANGVVWTGKFDYGTPKLFTAYPKLPSPATAQVGQIVSVKSIDESGKVTETETVDMPNRLDVTVSMGDNGWVVSHKFAEIKAAYDAGRAVQLIDTDTFKKYSLMNFYSGSSEGVTDAYFKFIDSAGDIWVATINSNDEIDFFQDGTFITLYGDIPQDTPKAITYSVVSGIGYADFIPFIEIPSTGDELKERLVISPAYFYVMPNAYAPFVLKNLVNPYTLTRLSYSEPKSGTEDNTYEASYLVTDSLGQQIKATCQVLRTDSGLGDLVWNFEVRDSLIVKSSTEGSKKQFKITVDDSGAISATEITN